MGNNHLEEKRSKIEDDVRKLLIELNIRPIVWSFGAFNIDPKHFVIVVGVQTNQERDDLKSDKSFIDKLRDLLDKHNWPEHSRKFVIFDIESEETVKNDNNGNWYHHYK